MHVSQQSPHRNVDTDNNVLNYPVPLKYSASTLIYILFVLVNTRIQNSSLFSPMKMRRCMEKIIPRCEGEHRHENRKTQGRECLATGAIEWTVTSRTFVQGAVPSISSKISNENLSAAAATRQDMVVIPRG